MPRVSVAMQLDGAQSIEDAVARVAERVKHAKPGEWIIGLGWNHLEWRVPNLPTKNSLDAIAPNNRVILDRKDGHSNGVIIIDNPGMRELGVISNESGLGDTFNEIDELSDNCKYKDCTHTVEAGCAILEAVEKGEISEERYKNYIKIYKESLYNEMSYVDNGRKIKSGASSFIPQ